MSREVVITGLGVVSAAGIGWEACGRSPGGAPRALEGFDASGFPAWAREGYQVAGLKPQPYMKRRKDLKIMSREAQLGLVAAGLAAEDAGVDPRDAGSWPVSAQEIGLYMGVGLEPGDVTEVGPAVAASLGAGGGIDLGRLGGEGIDLIPPLSALVTLPNMALAHVAINLELMGPGEALSPWGTAGLAALATAAAQVASGACEVALAGATDCDLDLSGVSRLLRLGICAEDGARLGEGAAFFVLESREGAERRGRRWLARVGASSALARPPARLGSFDPAGLAAALERVRAGCGASGVVLGASGGHPGWASLERAALEPVLAGWGAGWRLEQPGGRLGWCSAASGLLELGDALAQERVAPSGVGSLVALGWSPTGQAAALVLDSLQEGGR